MAFQSVDLELPTVPSTKFVQQFSTVVHLVASGQESSALKILNEVSRLGKPERTKVVCEPFPFEEGAHTPLQREPRRAFSIAEQAKIFARDHYTCRYCGVPTISLQVMNVVSTLFPWAYSLHPHWKYEKTDRSFSEYSTSLEHHVPIARGGTNEEDNLLTACAWCNYSKNESLAEELGWRKLPVAKTEWDGLSGYLPALLMRLDGKLKKYKEWAKIVGSANSASHSSATGSAGVSPA